MICKYCGHIELFHNCHYITIIFITLYMSVNEGLYIFDTFKAIDTANKDNEAKTNRKGFSEKKR